MEISHAPIENITSARSDGARLLRILGFQAPSLEAAKSIQWLDEKLQVATANQLNRPDIVILPENWLSDHNHSVDVKKNAHLASLCQIVAKHKVFALLGTQQEIVGMNEYTTAVFVGPDGQLIGTYRKRRPVRNTAAGKEVGIWNTAIGRVAILICFDIENREILEETLAAKPYIILNPIWIPQPQGIVNIHNSWNSSCETMARKFEATCRDNHIALVRVDMSAASGASGTSLACDWYKTLYAPSRTDCSFMFVVDRDGKFSGPPPERERTERVDNTGNRYAIKQIQSPDTSPVTSLTFFDRTRFVTASANGPLRVYKTPTRELLFASSKANIGTVSSMCIVSGANHIALATDTSHALSLFDLSASSSLSEPKQIELSSNLLSGSWSPFVKLISPEPNALFFCTANGIEFIDVRSESSRVLISKKPNEGDLIDFDIEEGKTLFATCSSSSVQIFDVRKVSHADTASPLHSFNWKNLTSVLLRKSVCFPGDTEGNIVSWKFETGREERRKGHCGAVRFFSKISSTLFLSASEDTTIALWREPDDQPSRLFTFEHTFRSHLVPITSLCANETYFLSGDASGRISLWEYQQNRTVKPFSIL